MLPPSFQENPRDDFRSGFIAIIGLPNFGKSTFLNTVIGQKISIVSNKPQTTRNQIRGIFNGENFQAVLIDTPGIHDYPSLLNDKMVQAAYNSLSGVDLVFFFSRANKDGNTIDAREKKILDFIFKKKTPVALILNKIDLSDPENIAKQIRLFNETYDFCETFPISALKKINLNPVIASIPKYLPQGFPLYGEDEITDQTERLIAVELVREQVFRQTKAEIPYNTLVELILYKIEKKRISMFVTVHVSRESQKKILLGKNGSMIKSIGTAARKGIETMTGKKVYLNINIKVTDNWSKKASFIKHFQQGF